MILLRSTTPPQFNHSSSIQPFHIPNLPNLTHSKHTQKLAIGCVWIWPSLNDYILYAAVTGMLRVFVEGFSCHWPQVGQFGIHQPYSWYAWIGIDFCIYQCIPTSQHCLFANSKSAHKLVIEAVGFFCCCCCFVFVFVFFGGVLFWFCFFWGERNFYRTYLSSCW